LKPALLVAVGADNADGGAHDSTKQGDIPSIA
jgi:hypothetical protein